MTIHETMKKELPVAMKARDEVRVRTIRALLTAFTNEAVAQKQKPDTIIDDETAQKVLNRAAKQRKDSIEQFEKGNRPDLASHEREELAVIEEYLPEQMSREEIERIARAKKEEMQIEDPQKSGMLMGAIMKEAGGTADGTLVKEVVDSLFS